MISSSVTQTKSKFGRIISNHNGDYEGTRSFSERKTNKTLHHKNEVYLFLGIRQSVLSQRNTASIHARHSVYPWHRQSETRIGIAKKLIIVIHFVGKLPWFKYRYMRQIDRSDPECMVFKEVLPIVIVEIVWGVCLVGKLLCFIQYFLRSETFDRSRMYLFEYLLLHSRNFLQLWCSMSMTLHNSGVSTKIHKDVIQHTIRNNIRPFASISKRKQSYHMLEML